MAAALLGALACGDDVASDAQGGSGTGSGQDSASTSTTAADGSSSIGETNQASSSADTSASSSPGTNGGQGGCEPDGDLLYPLAEGRVWTYDVLSGGCNDPTYATSVVASEMIGGREAFLVTTGSAECGMTENHLWQDGQAVDRYDPFNDLWVSLVAEPIEEGATFADGELQWETVDEITVPAGTFTGCWRAVSAQGGLMATTYCPGVGPVQLTAFELVQSLVSCE